MNWPRLRDQSIVAVAALIFCAVGLWLIGHVIGIVALVAVAIVVALVLEPLMVRAERYMPRLAAAATVYIVVFGSLGIAGFLLVPPLFHEATTLGGQLPAYIEQASDIASRQAGHIGIRVTPHQVTTSLNHFLSSASSSSPGVALAVVDFAGNLAAGMADIVFILFLAFYFMVDGRRMRAAIARLFPPAQRPKIHFVEETISTVLGAYVRSQLVMAFLMAVSAGIGCMLLGVRYPAVIGTFTFFAELVPMVGPFLAAIPAMIIAIFQSFDLMVVVTFFFVIMQIAENSIIRPRVTGPMVGLHPVEALLALVVGAATAGFWGALFAVPAVGIAVVLLTVVYKAWRGEPLEFQRRGMRVRLVVPDPEGGGDERPEAASATDEHAPPQKKVEERPRPGA
ncbi:MAG TPA: AI-2E family transporter [Candidatus Dormibacteraeota bacterium]|nr:AI-2E family transporter [Candidatus Dormibacteraeota bacterium]